MLPFIREHLLPRMRIPIEEDEEQAELSRTLSLRVLNHVVRRPYGQPRQVGSLLSIDRGLLDYGFRAASAGTLLYLGRGRASSMPALSVFRNPLMSYELLLAAFRGKTVEKCINQLMFLEVI